MRLSSTLLALGAAAILFGGLVGCAPTEQPQTSESSAANSPAGNTPETSETPNTTQTASTTTLEVPEGMESAVLNAKGMT
ncbi:MAG: hypothetical protein ACK47B_13000 [Armatimonadota bacterium]